MPFVQAKCPECGGMLAVDADKKAAVCQFCGEAFIVQEAINNYNTYNETINNYNTTHQYGEGAVVNVYEDQNKNFIIEAGVLKEYHGESVDVVIPDNVYEIGANAFENKKIKSITFSSKTTEIGSKAFKNCKKLTSVIIPDTVTEIGYQAFEGCSNLMSIAIPDSVTGIGWGIFSNCNNLTNITISNNITVIGDEAFYCCYNLKNIIVPDRTTRIGSRAFGGCSSLSSITIPDSVNEIGDSAFIGCASLTSITIPNSVTELDSCVFEGCTSLSSIIIPDSVTQIGIEAFRGCSSLTNITIPNGVKSIGSRAFSGCRSLINARIPETVKYIKYPNQYKPVGCLFENCSELKSVTIPVDILGFIKNRTYYEIESYDNFRGCEKLNYIEILYTNSDNLSLRRVLEKEMLQFVKAIHICRDVTSIGSYAFSDTNLSEVKIPDSVTKIGNDAFCGCTNLASITIPDSVTEIGSGAFSGCTSLASVTIPDSVTDIGRAAFAGCPKLVDIKMPSNITLGDYAFRSYWEQKGLCGKCGGNFNLFNKCKKCGMKKDY